MFSRQSFVALQHRNYRLLWIGLFVSFSGSMMQNAALLWHVSLLVPPDRKGLALGLVGLVRVGPIMVFSMISGVVADAWDRRKLMLFTQIAATIVAAALDPFGERHHDGARHQRAGCRGRVEPAVPLRADPKDVLGKNRQKSRRRREEGREEIQQHR